MRRRAHFLVEVAIAALLLGAGIVPVFQMFEQCLWIVQAQEGRAATCTLVHNLLERFAESESLVSHILKPSFHDPSLWEAVDPWLSDRKLAAHLGMDELSQLIRACDIHVLVQMRFNSKLGMDFLTCRASWLPDPGRRSQRESISYGRFQIRDHIH